MAEENILMMSKLLHADVDKEAKLLLTQVEEGYQRGSDSKQLCACCFGAISYEAVETMAKQVVETLCNRDSRSNSKETPVCIDIQIPPIMDAFRITARTVITRHADKLFPFPAIDELLARVLTARLATELNVVPSAEARVKVSYR